ncbi:esterase B1-like [Culicoides brevitarsis]|uniref:esterase B1-like n=1 Tax=Culicoides brevitarsis TaxID=469753 RepID=UPI00307B90B3
MTLIKTSYGFVKGIQKKSCYNKPYLAFYGIPYAKQPINEYRFKDARPLEPWEGILDATKVGDACWNLDRINPIEQKIIGSDNCLHLNIYVPDTLIDETKKKPVMVYIHAGRFTTMSSDPFFHGPDYLLEHDVVVVTFNYRYGAFGFLSLKDPSLGIPGNAGIKDQLMALKWLKSEIENFGGDSQKITVFGVSAGSCSTHLHLLYEPSRGLFQRAIIMAGTAFDPWAVRTSQGDLAYRLAKALGYEGDAKDEREIFKVISEADPVKVVQKQTVRLLNDLEVKLGQFSTFGPVVEPYITETTFIHEHPLKPQVWKNAWGNKIKMIIGSNSMDGLLFYPSLSSELMSSLGNFSHIIAENVHLDPNSETCIEKGLKLKNFYYGTENPSMENVDIYINILGDKNFWHGIWMALKAHHESDSYFYRFDVAPSDYNQTVRKIFKIPHLRGASHVEDIFYIFKAEYLKTPLKGSRDYEIIQTMTKCFADFAKHKNPSPKNIDWTPVKSFNDIKCLNFNENGVAIIDLPEKKRMEFWDEICETKFLFKSTRNEFSA